MKLIRSYLLFAVFQLLIVLNISGQLSGTYTIGGISPDFTTFTKAVDTLTKSGVFGNVVFHIRPGTYIERLNIPLIAGVSLFNQITFQAENGDSTSVTLKANATSMSTNYVVKLISAQYINFKKMTFSITQSTNHAYTIFYFSDGTVNSYLNFSNCVFYPISRAFWEKGSVTNAIFENNLFIGGAYGFEIAAGVDVKIVNNFFYDQTNGAITAYYGRGISIKGNHIYKGITNNNYEAILSGGEKNNSIIESNYIDVNRGNGIHLDGDVGTLVYNNFIHIWGSAPASGIYVTSTIGAKFYHNSVLITNISTGSSAFRTSNNCVSLTAINNNFINSSVGFVYNNLTPISDTCDYNNVSANGTYFAYWNGTYYNTFSSFKSSLNKDVNSVSIAPKFYSNTDLHIDSSNCGLKGKGLHLSKVAYDIDEDLRDNNAPDIGADEFTLARYFFVSDSIYQKGGNVGKGTTNFPVMCIPIKISGCEPPLTISSLTFGTFGTSNLSDIKLAKMFYTGTSSQFDTTITFGSTVVSPNGSFSFSSSLSLTNGTHYFWLAYDIDNTASAGNIIDATISQITLSSGNVSLSNSSPSGSFIVKSCANNYFIKQTNFCGYSKLNAGNGYFHLWSTGEKSKLITVNQSNVYSVKMTDTAGCVLTDTVYADIHSPIAINLTPSAIFVCPKSGFSVVADSLPYVKYHWYTKEQTIWEEDFNYSTSTIIGPGFPSKWTMKNINCTDLPSINVGAIGGELSFWRLPNCQYEWTSQEIDISHYANVDLSADVNIQAITGNYIKAYYIIDNGVETLFATNGTVSGPNVTALMNQGNLKGNKLKIVLKVFLNISYNTVHVYNIKVKGTLVDTITLNNKLILYPDVNTKLYVVATDSVSSCMDKDSISMNVVPLDATLNIIGETQICIGDSVKIFAGNGYTYQWSTGKSTSYIYAINTSNYWATITNSLGCSRISDTVTIANKAVPQVNISQSISGFTSHFTNTSIDAKSYLWNFGDGTSDTTSVPTHDFPASGTYTVTLTALNGNCSTTGTLITQINTGVEPTCINQPQSAIGFDIVADTSGYFYVVGQTYVSPNWAHVAKFAPNMDMVWATSYTSGVQHDWATSVDVDDYGNVYVGLISDFYEPTLIKYSSTGTLLWKKSYINADAQLSKVYVKVTSDNDIYFVRSNWNQSLGTFPLITEKYSSSGTVLWSKNFNLTTGSGASHIPNAIVTDNSDNIYVVGWSNALSNNDMITVKYDVSGNLSWSKTYSASSTSDEKGVDIDVDGFGSVYVIGNTTKSGQDNFVAVKYNNVGTQQWVYIYNGLQSNSDYAAGIEVDNEVYIAGNTYGKFTSFGYVALKLNTSGSLIWERQYNTNNGVANDAKLDLNGNFYIAGGQTDDNYFLIKYSPTGDVLWSDIYGPNIYGGVINAIDIDKKSAVYVTGSRYEYNNCYTLKYDGNLTTGSAKMYVPDNYKINVYPNPASLTVTIEIASNLQSNNYILDIYNSLGTKVSILKGNIEKFEFDTDNFADGIYLYEVTTDKKEIIGRGKLIINHK